MTRFQKEITGALGEYWQKEAVKRVRSCIKEAKRDAEVDTDGAIRWKSNGSYLMDDYCEILEFGEYPFNRKATAKKREEQVAMELENYRKNKKPCSEEELNEMKSTFDEGVTVINIFSGEEYKL